jgi:hypothetical protein
MPFIAAGAALLGGALSSNAQRSAARTSANAQTEAARIAAEEARFRPVGVTTRFGTSNFTFDENGRLAGAGYTLDPALAAIRDRMLSQAGGQGMGLADQGLGAAQNLFGLGQQYLAQSPQEAAQQWMQSQQAVLQPGREAALARTRQGLFNTGRGGLGISQGGDLAATNPEMAAYYNAIAQQDAQLAAQAQEQGRAQTQFGAGLFGLGAQAAQAGYSPFQTQLGLAGNIEGMGQSALDIGSTLGGRASQAGAQSGQSLLAGGLGAARTMQAANQTSGLGAAISGLGSNQQLIQGIKNWMSPSAAPDLSVVGYNGPDRGLWF